MPGPAGSRGRCSTTPSTRCAAPEPPTPTSRCTPARRPVRTSTLTWGELRDQVARARRVLVDLGVGPGDRVAGYLPNCPEALVAFLAAAGLGAVWTSCAMRVRPAQRDRPLRAGRAGRAAGGRRLPLRTQGRRPPRRGGRDPSPGCRACATCSTSSTATGASTRPTSWPEAARRRHRPAPRDAGRCPSTTRWSCCSPRARRATEGDRARPRRDRARAPEEPRPVLGPRPRRRHAVVLHHRLDDVERAGLRRCSSAPPS